MIPLVIAAFFLNQVLGTSIPVLTSQPEAQINISKRIVGGRISPIYKFPWMAAIEYNDALICGGSILSETVILTAAHCTEHLQRNLSVRVGSSVAGYGGSKHSVVEIKRREDYISLDSHSENDVALVRVLPPFQFGETVNSIVLANRDYVVVTNTAATVAGWGYTSELGPLSPTLRSTSVLIVDAMECAKAFGKPAASWSRFSGQICAAAPGRDACDGDSGGPLMNGRVQIGIVSWGLGCAWHRYPGVYMNITYHRDWIDKNRQILQLKDASPCNDFGYSH